MIKELLLVELASPVLIALLLLVMRGNLLLGILAILASSTSFTASLILLSKLIDGDVVYLKLVDGWLKLPYMKSIDVSFRVDPLSVLVSSLVCGLTTLILIYSISYMSGDEKYRDTKRYWFLMLIFMASMLVVVNSDNFLLMFIGWEGMSLCSYFLIGYYYGDERRYWIGGPPNKATLYPPTHCSYITFLLVGPADTLMLIGMLMLIVLTGSPYYEDLIIIKDLTISGLPEWATLIPLLFFLAGPIAKSAQFPLHIWLPYAMAGPTPVSALLHSATMVKAGVYIILRLLPYLTTIAETCTTASIIFYLLLISGTLSMISGAINAGRSLELKRILAYSTISQIGYMFILLGVAGFAEIPSIITTATLYHLINHALFKSALFLVAGILIHTTNTLYINEMGVPLNSFKQLFAITLISSLSLMGVPPLVGFWSKEFIIEALVGEEHYGLILITAVGSLLTAFYSTRMLIMTFSTSSKALHKHHDVGRLIYYPPLLLALTSLLSGVVGFEIKGNLLRLVNPIEEYYITHSDPLFLGMTFITIFFGTLLAVFIYELRILHISLHIELIIKFRADLKKLLTMFKHFLEDPWSSLKIIVRAVERVFTLLEFILNSTYRYVGMSSLKYLMKLFNAVGSADMDTFLTTYVITLVILLICMLVLIR
ncbi:MAG: NADH-quinone oxidoreductase subunit L [Sulfolobales archaeon]